MGARNPERKKGAETKTWNGMKQNSNWENPNAEKPNWNGIESQKTEDRVKKVKYLC